MVSQPLSHSCIVRRAVIPEESRSTGRPHIPGDNHILDCDGNTCEYSDLLTSFEYALINRSGLLQNLLGLEIKEGPDICVHLFDPLHKGSADFLGRSLSALDQFVHARSGQPQQILAFHDSITLGTLK